MSFTHWLLRFVLAFCVAFVVLLIAQLLKSLPLSASLLHAAVWGMVSAAIFTLLGYAKYRRSPACMIKRGKHSA